MRVKHKGYPHYASLDFFEVRSMRYRWIGSDEKRSLKLIYEN